ncbi:MAG TPA: hypothetical protein V6C58_05725 [Allocoleopsis sp.]
MKKININVPFKNVVSQDTLDNFNKEIKNVENSFIECDLDSLRGISLLKELDIISKIKQTKPIWEYLHNLYFITTKPDLNLVNKSKECISKIQEYKGNLSDLDQQFDISSIFKMMQNKSVQKIINKVAKDLSNQIQENNADPKDVMSDLLTNVLSPGNSSKSGVDMSSIITDTMKSLKNDIDNGEIQID